jgi:hypothetical protein
MEQEKRTMYSKSMKGLGEGALPQIGRLSLNHIYSLVHSQNFDARVLKSIAKHNAADTTYDNDDDLET